MEQKIRIAAIIIKDNKLLLVKGADKYKEYWTPGGKLEPGETEIECLKRELMEELNLTLMSHNFFREYRTKTAYQENGMTQNKVYIVEVSGNPNPSREITNYVWMSKNDFQNDKYPLLSATKDKVIPDLIKEGIFQ